VISSTHPGQLKAIATPCCGYADLSHDKHMHDTSNVKSCIVHAFDAVSRNSAESFSSMPGVDGMFPAACAACPAIRFAASSPSNNAAVSSSERPFVSIMKMYTKPAQRRASSHTRAIQIENVRAVMILVRRATHVVLPSDGYQSDRIDILVENDGHGDRQVEQIETLCTNRVW